MSNCVPNIKVTSKPNVPKWISRDIKNMMRKQNKLYTKYMKSDFNNNDKERVDEFRDESLLEISKSKQNYLKDL